ncbi:glycosyl hydrolase 115 family protein [Hymenobacter sp. GOD-10R]|uniref:glycosyl hydrolase 115 family protein n=1 Tax=Hymenobacter sp. GOD-10R TaxID=3093922 RepID=UPI002D79AA25|nr:glycosyl hydrolase 115 family protein [Hymenobacter sp. GOD-10R]WRQ26839.1 glycosyl hydrolase 115 family protein [Hymenobacter sp. GOD-10R]
MKKWFAYALIFLLSGLHRPAAAQQNLAAPVTLTADHSPAVFPLVHQHSAVSLYIDAQDAEVVRVAAEALAKDVNLVAGSAPALRAATEPLTEYSVIIGTLGHSRLIDQLASRGQLDLKNLKGQWETFTLSVVEQPLGKPGKALVIAGSDRRGTAYGVFELSRRLGVSPWYWWADVPPQHQANLYLTAGTFQSAPPSVKYRGIFLNDEDWGLQPWAAQNLDKDIKDIGPNTYAHLFELLLRLKANLIWPAMHPSTKAFFHYPGNPPVADRYAILVGTSHAEPMLRNNVDEWNEKTMGPFDYFRNKPAVYNYWNQRAKEASQQEAIYSLGMRGVHDSGMEGAKTPKEAAQMLGNIIADQRGILRNNVAKDVTRIPQVFTLYKEVLDVYDQGLKLPDDVTLVWPDDNYGYISRLANAEEQRRAGRSGVYYHASYWGRPHDYLWLSSTHPALIREEMMKAYAMQADGLWVLNVGDLKPLEYNTQLFLDMAYNAQPFQESQHVPAHLEQWMGDIFGSATAASLRHVLWEYYDLAFERRPEFMGWSRTEPTTPTTRTEYNHFYYGDEAQRRLDRYAALVEQVKQLRTQISSDKADAFYELVYYPVLGAALMNQKFLYADKSELYARQNRASACDYATLAQQAYAQIEQETEYFNQQLAGGKWQGMMSMKPRNLPVYQAPVLKPIPIDTTFTWRVAPEGEVSKDSSFLVRSKSKLERVLPTFYPWGQQHRFIDLFLSRHQAVSWKAKTSAKWITLSAQQGQLLPTLGRREQRVQVSIDWSKAPKHAKLPGRITFTAAGQKIVVWVSATGVMPEVGDYAGFIESNGYVSMDAANYTRKTDKAAQQWASVPNLGLAGSALQAQPLQAASLSDTTSAPAQAAVAEYDFYALSAAVPTITVFTLPTHELTSLTGMRYGVALDDQPMHVVDFRTVGRSEEWKQNVLRNNAQRQIKAEAITPGRHTLKVYALDPGVVLDRITIDLGGLKPHYSPIPETRKEASAQERADKTASNIK